ncbi:MAG: BamA/TamA family outer membrane protein, partial [Nitrospirae bacterium]|nr:BamA/TamA family outer membrane protein [Nitrospirota bacterium]
ELQSLRADELPRFEPSIEVSLDEANKDRYKGFKFRLENIFGGTIGISDDQTWVAQIGFEFVDYLGDRRIFALFESISSFQNFDVFYVDSSRRLTKSLRLYDNNDFFAAFNQTTGRVERIQSALRLTGITATVAYPFGVNHRVSGGLGYVYRDIGYQSFLFDPDGRPILDPETGLPIPIVTPRTDNYPQLEAALVGDTTVFAGYGPIAGRRWRLFGSYAPNLTGEDKDIDSTLTSTYGLDFRQYLSTTRRTNFAWRLWGASSNGAAPTPLYIGGLDTIRGYEFRSLVGDRAFFSNLEWRFPLIDYLAIPGFAFQQIRGVLFLDVGGAWYSDVQSFQFWDSETNTLEDAVSSYGWGFSLNLFGLAMNWDFVRQWDFSETLTGWETSFWIGRRF